MTNRFQTIICSSVSLWYYFVLLYDFDSGRSRRSSGKTQATTATRRPKRKRSTLDGYKDGPAEPPKKLQRSLAIPGIANMGNTCYMSTAVETIFSARNFVAKLLKTHLAQTAKYPNKKMPLTKVFLALAIVRGVLDREGIELVDDDTAELLAANPEELKAQMEALTDKFHGCAQQDPHEFISHLIDCLHEELALLPPSVHLKQDSSIEVSCTVHNDATGKDELVWLPASVQERTDGTYVLSDDKKGETKTKNLYGSADVPFPVYKLHCLQLEGKNNIDHT